MYLKSFIRLVGADGFCSKCQLHKSLQTKLISRRYSVASPADDGESNEDGEKRSRAGRMLDNSSPLKRGSLDINQWATTPYPDGTFFKVNTQSQKSLRPLTDPKQTSIILFPGQGTQFVGMGNEVLHIPVVKDMFAVASEILGYDLLKLCLKGPIERLNETEYCQPAVLVCSLAAVERLKEEFPEAINGCIATAGFSVGELAALVFAGCITFERAIRLVQVRAKAMQVCSETVPGGMMTALLGADSNLKEAMKDAKEHCLSKGIIVPVCTIANYLFPSGKVIAGDLEALHYLATNSEKYKIRKLSRLPVSGAFHTDLMRPAAETFREVLRKSTIQDPIISVHSNVDGLRYHDAGHIFKKLPKQIYLPVKWEQIMQILYSRAEGIDFPNTYECGPGRSLQAILRKVNAKAHSSYHKIQV